MTQNEKVLAYIRKHGSITQLEAARDLGCFRLGARIWELRHSGHDIASISETSRHADGSACVYARYFFGTNERG